MAENDGPIAIPLTLAALKKDREYRLKKRELICYTHDKILDAAERIATYDMMNARVNELDQMHAEIIELASYITELVGYAKERGQAMEDRLSAYSNAIEDLGFKRTRR